MVFPRLKSCYLFEPRILEIIPQVTSSTQLRILKMDNIDILNYKDVLSLCPNLYLFEFTMLNEHEETCLIKPHLNLKRMFIKFQSHVKTVSDCAMNHYLSCVPNLEELNLYEINFEVNMTEYLNSNWFALLIDNQLTSLRRFKYYLLAYGIKQNNEDVINRIKTSFNCIHKNRYKSRLVS